MPARIERHLSHFDIVGVAGTTLLRYAAWHLSGPPHIFGQVLHPFEKGKLRITIYGAPYPVVRDIQAIDGLFMAARHSVFSQISFDPATFDGFHLWVYDKNWQLYANRFSNKWLGGDAKLPENPFAWATAVANTRDEALQIMTPPYWQQCT
jgi:hypothetical protein